MTQADASAATSEMPVKNPLLTHLGADLFALNMHQRDAQGASDALYELAVASGASETSAAGYAHTLNNAVIALHEQGKWQAKELDAARAAIEFQPAVARWMGACFASSLCNNVTERGDRLLEEVLELLQSKGYDRGRVATLVDYVYGRPAGVPAQEVGGVMVTLAAYCWVSGLDMAAEGSRELKRISQPEVMEKIRAKQEAKKAIPFDSPLPGHGLQEFHMTTPDVPLSEDTDKLKALEFQRLRHQADRLESMGMLGAAENIREAADKLEVLSPPAERRGEAERLDWLPDEGAYLVRFDDASREDVTFAGASAKECALRYYREASDQWNAHLFVKIDSNSRDCETPSAVPPSPTGQPVPRNDVAVIGGAFPKAREVARIGDMDPKHALRVGLDGDGDVYLSTTDAGGGVEFCTTGSGGGKSPRTHAALVALMDAMEADNAADPRRDWWALRLGPNADPK